MWPGFKKLGQGRSDPNTVLDTPSSQDTPTHQNLGFLP